MLQKKEILYRLLNSDQKKVAQETGISYQTLWRLLTGRAPNVTYDIIEKLSVYFEEKEIG